MINTRTNNQEIDKRITNPIVSHSPELVRLFSSGNDPIKCFVNQNSDRITSYLLNEIKEYFSMIPKETDVNFEKAFLFLLRESPPSVINEANKIIKENYKNYSPTRLYIHSSCTRPQENMSNCIVYIPVCYGGSRELKAEDLKRMLQVIEGAKEVIICLGNYNNVKVSVECLEEEGKKAKENWLSRVKNILSEYKEKAPGKIRVAQYPDWKNEKSFKDAEDTFDSIMEDPIKKTAIYAAIRNDVYNFAQNSIKSENKRKKLEARHSKEDSLLVNIKEETNEKREYLQQEDHNSKTLDRVIEEVMKADDPNKIEKLAVFYAAYSQYSKTQNLKEIPRKEDCSPDREDNNSMATGIRQRA